MKINNENHITKKTLEKYLGYEINDYRVTHRSNNILHIAVIPKTSPTYINMSFTIKNNNLE